MKTYNYIRKAGKIPSRIRNKIRSIIGDIIKEYANFEPLVKFDIVSENLRHLTLNSKEQGITDTAYFPNEQLIVSLTTYGKRLYNVYLAIESIMQQTRKANRIVLWLDEALKDTQLPQTIILQQKRGLEIRYCKDIKSYKKLIPALQLFPNDTIVTIDDDAIYHHDLLEEMIKTRLEEPNCIICNRYHKIKLNKDGSLKPYLEWDIECKEEAKSHLCFSTGVGGVMYPPASLSNEVFNEKVFTELCPFADDVWFKAMAIINNVPYKPIPQNIHKTMYIDIPITEASLLKYNVLGKGNDKALSNVFKHYCISFNVD